MYDFKKAKVPYLPMEHQSRMLDTSWNLPASAWFAKMGTGKTFATIHLAFARWRAGLIDKLVIICPSTLRKTWEKELAKYATGSYDFRIHDTKAKWLNSFYNEPDPDRLKIMAVSVEGLGVSESLFDSVCGMYVGGRVFTVVDESSRIKTPEAKRTQRTIEFGPMSDYRLILNGTPIALGIHDLWSQYEFLDPNIIGSGDYWAFKTRYIETGGYENKQIVGYKDVEELMNLIIPYTVAVTKEVLNLPPKVYKTVYVEPSPEQQKLFRLIVKGASSDPNAPFIKVDNTLEQRLRLRQVVGGWLPRGNVIEKEVDGEACQEIETVVEPLGSNPKFDALLNLIEDHYVGSKFIIWSPFTHEIEALAAVLSKRYGPESVACYYGAVDADERSRIEDRYCNDPSLRFFIGNPAAAGLGLTLISGESDIMLYYSGTDAYIDRAQSEDRSHRIGQNNTVTVVDFVMEHSVDVIIQAATKCKMNIETYVFDRIKEGVKMEDILMGVDTDYDL